MRYEAVIFDLFGTLVDNISANYTALLKRKGVLARLAPGREQAFQRIWAGRDARRLQTLGILDTASLIRHTCAQLNQTPDHSDIERAVELRLQRFREALIPRQGTVEALTQIKRAGHQLGLISDCSPEVAALWPRSMAAQLFDEMLFSCQIGLAKPERRLYQLACERLGATPNRCLYVGDGDRKELTGAQRAGLDAVLLCAPYEEGIVMQRAEARNWDGPRVATIADIPALLAERETARAPARATVGVTYAANARLDDMAVRL